MLRRLSTHLKLTLLALALVTVPGALVVAGQSQWAHRRLQELLARQLAQTVKREVYVGPVSGNVLRGLTIEGLAIAERQRLSDGAVLSAERLRLSYDLISVLRGHLAPAASVRTVELVRPRAHVVRERGGRFNLQRLLVPVHRPPEQRFRGTVVVQDAAIFYEDYSPYVKLPPLRLHLAGITGTTDAHAVTRLVSRGHARVTDGRAGAVSGQVILDTNSPFVDVAGSVTGVDAAWAMAVFGLAHGYTVRGGRADLHGAVYRVATATRPKIDYSATVNLHGVTATAPRLPGAVRLEGTTWAGRSGLDLRAMALSFAGSRYALAGQVSDLRTPVLNLSLASDQVHLAPLTSLPQLAPLRSAAVSSAPVAVRVTAVGPATNPDLRVRVGTRQPLSFRLSPLGTVRAGNLQVAADIVSAATAPAVRGTLKGRQLALPAYRTGAAQWPRTVSLAATKPFTLSFQSCGGTPAAQGEVQIPSLRADNLRLTNVRGRLALTGELLRLQDLRAGVLGGELLADGLLQLRGPAAALRLRGSLRGAQLARLKELPVQPPGGLRGSANLGFQALVSGQRVTARANLAGTEVQVGEAAARSITGTLAVEHDAEWSGAGRLAATGLTSQYGEADRAQALVRWREAALHLDSGFVTSPLGLAWARGEVDLRGKTLDLQVDGAELALGALSRFERLKDARGVAYASGTVSGSFSRPAFAGRLIAFQPAWGEYGLDAATAQVRVEGDTLRATELLASRGSATLSGEGSVGNLGRPPEQMPLQARLQGQGVRLAEAARIARKDWPVDGLGEFEATVSGTLGRPRGSGEIRVANAHYQNLPVARASLPFVVDRQRLTFSDIAGLVLDAPFSGRLALDLAEPAEVEGQLEVGQVRLEGLAPFWKPGIALGGTATLSHLRVWGPANNLQGSARLSAPELNLGGEIVRNVDANVTLGKGLVQLQETTLAAAGGELTLKAGYDYAVRPHTVAAQIGLHGTRVPGLLYLAVPLTQAFGAAAADRQAETRRALRSYALRLGGTLNGTVNLSGPIGSPTAVADVAGEGLVLDGRAVPDLTGKGTVSAEGVRGMSLAASQGEALITAEGDLAFDGPIKATVEGSGINLGLLRPWVPLELPYGGRLDFTVVATGQTRHPDLMASVDVTNPTFAGVGFDVLTVPLATVREGQITVDTLVIKRGQQEMVVDGRLPFSWSLPVKHGETAEVRPGLDPNGQIVLGGHIDRTDLAFFLPLIDEYLGNRRPGTVSGAEGFRWASVEAAGKVDSSLEVRGTPAEPVVRGYLRLEDGTLQPKAWPRPLTEVQADVALTGSGGDNRVQVNTLTAKYDKLRVDCDGTITVTSPTRKEFWRNRFDVLAQVSAPAQELAGGLQLADVGGGLSLRTNAAGEQVVRAEDLHAKVGEARATLSGQAQLANFALADLAENAFDLTLEVKPGRVTYASLLDATVGGRLQVVTPPGRSRAVIRGNCELSGGALGTTSTAAGGHDAFAASSRLPRPDLDVQVAIGQGLRFRSASLTAALEPNTQALVLRGTPQAPEVRGSVVARGGSTSVQTATLRLTYFRADYNVRPVPGDRRDPPELRAVATVSGQAATTVSRPGDRPIEITVDISGSMPENVQIQTSSNPALTETQIYALLGGVPFAHLPGVSRDPNMTQMVSDQFLATLANAFRARVFQPLEEQLKRALGLSELGITFAFDQPVSVQVGKYLLQNLLVSYERPLGADTDRYDLRVSYELPGGLRITYHEDERNDQRLEVGHSFSF